MRAGRLRHTLDIQQDTPGRDAAGGEVSSWAAVVSAWPCEIHQVKGGETFRGRVVHAQASSVAIGRYVTGVSSRMRAVFGTRIFDIKAVDDRDNRSRELRLDLAERGL